jgi:hypothetical protein
MAAAYGANSAGFLRRSSVCIMLVRASNESLTAAWVQLQRLPLRTPKSPLPHASPKLTPHVFRSASYLVQMPPPCTRLRLLRHNGLAAWRVSLALRVWRCEHGPAVELPLRAGRQLEKRCARPAAHTRSNMPSADRGEGAWTHGE